MASQGALELDSVLQKRASKGLKGLAGVYHRRLKRVWPLGLATGDQRRF